MIFLFPLSGGEEENEIISLYLHSGYSKWWLQELQCFLLAFVKNLHLNKLTSSTDGAIISYINKTIYHHYIALSKGNRHKIPTVSIEDKSDFDSLQFDSNFGESDTYSNLLLMDLQRALTADEYHVIYDHFFRQDSIQAIAARDKKSRQAINKCKKIALEKLRRYWGIKQLWRN